MRLVNSFHPCDGCLLTSEELDQPHEICEVCDDFVGCTDCISEHLAVDHGTERLETVDDEDLSSMYPDSLRAEEE